MSSSAAFPVLPDDSLAISVPSSIELPGELPERQASECLVHKTAVIDYPASIGPGAEIGPFAHVAAGAKIGAGCRIGQNVQVASTAVLGSGVTIEGNVVVGDGVTLEDGVRCGPGVVFTAALKSPGERPDACRAPIHLGPGVAVEANATILAGTTIGQYALICAGAVVRGAVPPYAVMSGARATPTDWVCRCGRGRLDFTLNLVACCPLCGQHYRMEGPRGPREFCPREESARRKAELHDQERRYVESIMPSTH